MQAFVFPLLQSGRTLVNLYTNIQGSKNHVATEEYFWGSVRSSFSRVLPNQSLDGANACRGPVRANHARPYRLRAFAWRGFLLASVIGSCFTSSVQATTPSPWTSVCSWESIGAKYGLNPYLLHAIAKQESGLKPHVISKPNSNGSVDIGLMQINSSWLPTLNRRFGIQRQDLFRSCVNLDVGAWVLYQNIQEMGYNWRAIGAYNARTDWKRLNYVKNVYRHVPKELKQK